MTKDYIITLLCRLHILISKYQNRSAIACKEVEMCFTSRYETPDICPNENETYQAITTRNSDHFRCNFTSS